MQIQSINNNIATNYYNRTKTNNAPAFKGVLGYHVRYDSDFPDVKKIDEFIANHTSPGVYIYADMYYDTKKIYAYPLNLHYKVWQDASCDCNNIYLPKKDALDLNFYITNAEIIEYNLLDTTIDYCKQIVNKINNNDLYERSPWSAPADSTILETLTNYHKKQSDYVEKHSNMFSKDYKAKLADLKVFLDGEEFQNACKKVSEAVKRYKG